MFVRRLQEKEVLDGLHLVWEVFAESNAPHMSAEGVEAFRQFIKMENFMPKVTTGEMAVFGAMDGNALSGICAVRKDGHVSLFFVKKCWQRRGVGRLLMQEAIRYAERGIKVSKLTVNAAPQAVEIYRHLGFAEVMEEQEKDGVQFVPMERVIRPGESKTAGKGDSHIGLIAGVCITVALLFGVLVFLVGKITLSVADLVENRPQQQQQFQANPPSGEGEAPSGNEENSGSGDSSGKEEASEKPSNEGIESIRCYEAEKLPYTVKEEAYTYSSNGQSGEYPMEFDVSYPQIEGLDSEKAEKVNKILKECAMSTVDTIYLNPSEAIKEAMLKERSPFLASQVKYKVTYAGEDFISVVFTDHYFVGSYYAEFQDLRTRNIRLSDGTVFETADLVELTDEFMEEWLVRMKKEAAEAEVLDGLTTSQFRRILNGEILDNRYYDNFFVDAEGLQIGLTYHYCDEENTVIERDWITAPFKMKEIVAYKKENDFWNLVQSND